MNRREILGRAALVVLSVPLAILVLEGALQLASLFVDASGRAGEVGPRFGTLRILCLGDSNTFGLHLEPEQSYPRQLEGVWNADPEFAPIEVINLGFPGTNSSMLLRDAPDAMQTLMPDVVTVMAGVNDFWTAPVEVEEEVEGASRWRDFIARHSRAYRLLFIVRRSLVDPEVEVSVDYAAGTAVGVGSVRYGGRERRMRWDRGSSQESPSPRGLPRNLGALVERIRAKRAEPVLLTFPARTQFYGKANHFIRAAAEETGVLLIDLEYVFRRACPDRRCDQLLFPDGHIRAAGNELVAATIRDRLRRHWSRDEGD